MKGVDRRRILQLLESYEPLLTSRQIAIMDAYFRYDLSLGEIAEEEGLSRAGALDAIKVSIRKLEEYEEKLGLCKKQAEMRRLIQEIDEGKKASYEELKEMIEHGI